MKSGIVVERRVYIKVPKALKRVRAQATKDAVDFGISRAKVYVPVDTGRLRRSIREIDDDSFGSKVRYAGFVENGTSKMFARPYMEPAIRDVKDNMPKIVLRAFVRWMKR